MIGNPGRSPVRRRDVKKLIIILSMLSLVLAACGSGDAADEPVDSDLPAPTLPPADPGLPPADPSQKPPTESDKVPENAGQVFIESADLLIMESFPIQVRVDVTGTLPTPCHGLSWVIQDDGTTIDITVFSIEPGPAVSCIAVEEPFQLGIDVGSFADEARTVVLNGEPVGEFTS